MKKHRNRNIFWGAFLVLGAALLVLSQLNIFPKVGIWSILLTIFFVSFLITSLYSLRFGGIFFSLAFLGIIYKHQLHIEVLSPWTLLLVALLLTIGFHMLVPWRIRLHRSSRAFRRITRAIEADDDSEGDGTGDPVHLSVHMGGSIKYVNNDNFKSAIISSSMANMKVYFDNAVIRGKEAVIQIDSSMSNIKMYVPMDWNIISDVDVSMGNIDLPENKRFEGQPKLHLVGRISMGNVKIRPVRPAADHQEEQKQSDPQPDVQQMAPQVDPQPDVQQMTPQVDPQPDDLQPAGQQVDLQFDHQADVQSDEPQSVPQPDSQPEKEPEQPSEQQSGQ